MRERRGVGPARCVTDYGVLAFGRQTVRHVIGCDSRWIDANPNEESQQICADGRVSDFVSGNDDRDCAVWIVGAFGISVTDDGERASIGAIGVDERSVFETDCAGCIRAHIDEASDSPFSGKGELNWPARAGRNS
jgi:hypothetical protein